MRHLGARSPTARRLGISRSARTIGANPAEKLPYVAERSHELQDEHRCNDVEAAADAGEEADRPEEEEHMREGADAVADDRLASAARPYHTPRVGRAVGEHGADHEHLDPHRGELFGVPPSGGRIQLKDFHFFRFFDGKIVEHWNQINVGPAE